jgi:prepilin-type N-terminal cleavage/methylation domain-containing protein
MRRRRNAYTLIETLTAMSVMGLLLLLTSSTLFGLFASNRQLNERTVAIGSLSRLSLQLRADAHQARQASLRTAEGSEPATLTLQLSDEVDDQLTVEYLADSAGVRRTVMRHDEPVHRELYRLHSRDVARWQLTDEEPPRLVLQIGPDMGSTVGMNDVGGADPGGVEDEDQQIASGPTDILRLETRVGLLTGGTREEGAP